MARQVPDQSAYAPGYRDPVRPVSPYVPTEVVVSTGKPTVPILGVVILAGVVWFLEHRRRRGGR